MTTPAHTLDDWLHALEASGWKGRRSGREWKGPCPRCGGDDRFHVGAGKATAVVTSCRGGCTFDDLRGAIFGKPGVPATRARDRNRAGAWKARQTTTTAPPPDVDRLDPAQLTLDVLMALKLTVPWRKYLASRGLDSDRLFRYGWRSVDGAAGWKPLADLPARYGWPAWPNGRPYWPLGVDYDSALIMPYRGLSRLPVGLRIRAGRRWIEHRKAKGQDAPKCLGLTGVPAQLYGADALGDHLEPQGVIHIAEGEIDTESLREHGVTAIGVPGASVWKTEWTEWIREREPRRVVIWFDGDQAGAAGGKRLRDKLGEFEVLRLTGVQGQDVNDLAREDRLADLIKESERG